MSVKISTKNGLYFFFKKGHIYEKDYGYVTKIINRIKMNIKVLSLKAFLY